MTPLFTEPYVYQAILSACVIRFLGERTRLGGINISVDVFCFVHTIYIVISPSRLGQCLIAIPAECPPLASSAAFPTSLNGPCYLLKTLSG